MFMPQEFLYHPQGGSSLEQMGGETVSQRMGGNPIYSCLGCSGHDYPVDRSNRQAAPFLPGKTYSSPGMDRALSPVSAL